MMSAKTSQKATKPGFESDDGQGRQNFQMKPARPHTSFPYSLGAGSVPMNASTDKSSNPELLTEETIRSLQHPPDVTTLLLPFHSSNSNTVEQLLPTLHTSHHAEDDQVIYDTLATIPNTAFFSDAIDSTGWCDLSLYQDSFPATFPPTFSPGGENVRIASLRNNLITTNAWKVEEPCLWYLSQAIDLRYNMPSPGTRQDSRQSYDSVRAAIAALDFDGGIVCDVAKVGLDIILMYSGCKHYVYGVGAHGAMEKILRWRLSPSEHNYCAIPEPFRPTAVQLRTIDYSMAIDIIPWPTIRDQLIMKAGWYDHDRTIKDLSMNAVIEIPTLGVAISIHETFFSQVLSPAIALTNLG
jgi:hypothetical protein